MRFRFFCVLLGLAMGWMVAGTAQGIYLPPKVDKPSIGRPAAFYTPGRQIGLLKKGSTCPPVRGWKAQTLPELAAARAEEGVQKPYGGYGAPPKRTLADRKKQARADALFRKYGLDRFCVYTDLVKGRPFRKPAGLSKADPDRMALIPSATTKLDPLGEQIWGLLADRFLDQVGKVQLGTVQNPTVRLVFVDTQQTGEGPPAIDPASLSSHGYGMAHLANEILCGQASQNCPIHIATRLALRYGSYDTGLPDDPGRDHGGRQGRIGDLAAEIMAEIDHWLAFDPETNLILNLSIGWDGEYKDLDANKEAELETSTQAVYDALQVARDLGVLVIAAAGNRTGGEDSNWPFLPAAWELHPPSWPSRTLGKEVAYAVGGVDWQGLPLPNARPHGMPSRVAYADHAVARVSDGQGSMAPTKIYTGSSVSAVVASSIAAVTWNLLPELKPAKVMEKMDEAADPLPSFATFYTGTNPSAAPHLQRLSLCGTVLKLCVPGVGQCPAVPYDCQSPHLPADFSKILPLNSSPAAVISSIIHPACDPQTQVFKEGMAFMTTTLPLTSGCPIETVPDVGTPGMTQPLPGETPCPPCNIAADRSVSSFATGPAAQLASLTPSLNLLTGDGSGNSMPYSLAAAFDPDWLAQANPNAIESAILVIECSTGSPTKERLDLTQEFIGLLSDSQPGQNLVPMKRIGFGPIDGRTSIAGCTASVDFTLSVTDANGNSSERSVQSPVYVDP
jgi:hypothetical protein